MSNRKVLNVFDQLCHQPALVDATGESSVIRSHLIQIEAEHVAKNIAGVH